MAFKGLPVCVVTGCALVRCDGTWVHGDLHVVGSAYVFNAVLNANGEAAWVYDKQLPGDRKALMVTHPDALFERRGVVVVDDEHAHLNEAASNYVLRAAAPRG